MDKITYDDVIKRIGYFRTKANLSMREASLQLGYNPQFMSTIENKSIELKVKTLLDFCNMLEITPQDFFYMGESYNKEDKNVLDLYNNLSQDGKLLTKLFHSFQPLKPVCIMQTFFYYLNNPHNKTKFCYLAFCQILSGWSPVSLRKAPPLTG